MVRRRLAGILATLAIATIVVSARPQEPSTADGARTLAGCLRSGATEGTFNLVVDESQTYAVVPNEGLDVASHVNHRVELTGPVDKTETSAVIRAAALKMIADSCE